MFLFFLSFFCSFLIGLSALGAFQTEVAEPKNNYCSVFQMVSNIVGMQEVTTHTIVLTQKVFL
jgi:hypothetical protein